MKKLLSVFLVSVMIFAFCACGKKNTPSSESSNIPDNEGFSSVTTQNETESEKNTTSKVTSTKTSSKKAEKSSTPASQKNETVSKTTQNTSSKTVSSDIKTNVKGTEQIGLGFYHFNIDWAKNNKNGEDPSFEQRLKEFKGVVENGYVNMVIFSAYGLDKKEVWDVIVKNDLQIWISVWDYFDSSKQTLDEFIKTVDDKIAYAKSNSEYWSHICGFHYDEPIWRGESNQDYLDMTKALYKKYGKRNFPVFATGEFTNYEGNAMQIKMDASNMKKIHPDAMKYTSDVGYDSYSYDVRDGYSNGSQIDKLNATYPEIHDGKSYYEQMTKEMLKVVGHDANVWFFPCGYTTNTWGGYRVDEGYVDAHIKFFTNLLNNQKYQGGLVLYTYQDFSNEKELGLRHHLAIDDLSVQTLMFPGSAKWYTVSETIRNTVESFRETKAKHTSYTGD